MRFKAFVDSALNCPSCGAEYDDFAWMPWGLCGAGGSNFAHYRPGDTIRWRSNAGAPPPPSTRLFPDWLWNSGVPEASIVPINLGDPSTLNAVIEDARFDATLPFPECERCGGSFFAAVEVRNGTVVGSLTCQADDPIVAEVRKEVNVLEPMCSAEVQWLPGIEDDELDPIDRLIETCGIAPVPEWPYFESAPDDWLDGMNRHTDSVRNALDIASGVYPGRLVRFAMARRLGKDPFYFEDWQSDT